MNDGARGKPREWRIWSLALTLAGAAFALACRLADSAAPGEGAAGSVAAAILGESRLALSDAFYLEADTTFHQGVGHYRPRAFTGFFVKLGQEIIPGGHVHLQAGGVAEVVPWLYLATRLDPGNVTAYAVAAFWLAGEAGRPDLAERVLAEARRANPRDYRVYLESGCLAIKLGNLARAKALLETALTLWPGKPEAADPSAPLDLAEILMYRGLLYENDGALAQAREMYRRVLGICPERRALRERLAFLETQGRSPSPPFQLWQSMLFRHAAVCDQEKEAEGGHRH